VRVQNTLVVVRATNTRSSPASITGACKRARRISTRGVSIAVVRSQITFIVACA
jgi:hypothetical protein